jgi:membrane AbrB-like protein
MAEAYNADVRLVAFMQYLRVVCVASTASAVARIWGLAGRPAAVSWFAPIAPLPFAETLVLAGPGALAAHFMRIPAGPLLLPLVVGAILQDTKLMVIDLPPWLLAISYAAIGWSIGLRFTRPILVYAARSFPRILLSIIVLIAICALFSVVLARAAHVDPMTAYLAMSPGGADSVAIIAASSKVDVSFVMALQTARFVVVLLIGPSLARFIAERAGFSQH